MQNRKQKAESRNWAGRALVFISAFSISALCFSQPLTPSELAWPTGSGGFGTSTFTNAPCTCCSTNIVDMLMASGTDANCGTGLTTTGFAITNSLNTWSFGSGPVITGQQLIINSCYTNSGVFTNIVFSGILNYAMTGSGMIGTFTISTCPSTFYNNPGQKLNVTNLPVSWKRGIGPGITNFTTFISFACSQTNADILNGFSVSGSFTNSLQ